MSYPAIIHWNKKNGLRDSMTDEDLARRIDTGDQDAFTTLYERYQASIFRFAYHMTGHNSAAEDITQEVFLTLLQAQNHKPEKGSFAAYLYGIARHQAFRWLKKNRPYIDLSRIEMSAAPNASREDPIERVRRAVLTLPVSYREVVILCELQEKSYAEAAEILRCPVGTVRSRLHRARGLLQMKLAAQKEKGACYELPAL